MTPHRKGEEGAWGVALDPVRSGGIVTAALVAGVTTVTCAGAPLAEATTTAAVESSCCKGLGKTMKFNRLKLRLRLHK